MKKTELTVRPLSGIDLSGVPEVIRVLPKGHVSSTKGDFEVDDRDIAGIIQQFKYSRKYPQSCNDTILFTNQLNLSLSGPWHHRIGSDILASNVLLKRHSYQFIRI